MIYLDGKRYFGVAGIDEAIRLKELLQAAPYKAAQLWYDKDSKTVVADTGIEGVMVNIGQETHWLVINTSGVVIPNGTPAYAYTVDSSGLIDVRPANASTLRTARTCLGLATGDIADGAIGIITKFGVVRDFDTSGFVPGRQIYLDITDGDITQSKPDAPNYIILLGIVLKVDADEGMVHVEVNTSNLRPSFSLHYTFTSSGVGAGTYYVGGYYQAPSSDVTLTQASPSVSYGSVNEAHDGRAFVVAGGAGTVTGGGQVELVISGTSLACDGVLTPGDSKVLVEDITTLSLNDYAQTSVKWFGPITFSLNVVSGSPTAYSVDCNYGLVSYDSASLRDFTVSNIRATGIANSTDTSFDIELLYHRTSGWTYSATSFEPGDGVIVSMRGDLGTPSLINDEPFAWCRHNIYQTIEGSNEEGVIIKITAGANNSVQSMDINVNGFLEEF